jgi:hypothetical protein
MQNRMHRLTVRIGGLSILAAGCGGSAPSAPSLPTRAHIHNGAAGANAWVSIDTTLGSGEMLITNGSGSITKTAINVPADKASRFSVIPQDTTSTFTRRSIRTGRSGGSCLGRRGAIRRSRS